MVQDCTAVNSRTLSLGSMGGAFMAWFHNSEPILKAADLTKSVGTLPVGSHSHVNLSDKD